MIDSPAEVGTDEVSWPDITGALAVLTFGILWDTDSVEEVAVTLAWEGVPVSRTETLGITDSLGISDVEITGEVTVLPTTPVSRGWLPDETWPEVTGTTLVNGEAWLEDSGIMLLAGDT